MSVVLYRNCPTCGQPFEIHEETHNRVFLMGGEAVQECVVCGAELEEEPGVKYATTKVFKKGEGDG